MPLSMVREGDEVKIHWVVCGRGLRARLCDLGLYEGTRIKVVKNDVFGPVILKVKGSKIVIGRGQAQKIMAEPTKGGEDEQNNKDCPRR